MGCNVSVGEKNIVVQQNVGEDLEGNEPQLTEAERIVIQNSWQKLKLHIANIGVLTYVR